MEITAITAALNGIKTASDIAKLINESNNTLEKAEQKLKFAELLTALAEIRTEVANLQGIIIERDEKIRELETSLKTEKDIIWDQPYYWQRSENNGKDGPFCQRCYDKEKNLIRLQSAHRGFWQCRACSNNFTDSQYHDDDNRGYEADHDPYKRI